MRHSAAANSPKVSAFLGEAKEPGNLIENIRGEISKFVQNIVLSSDYSPGPIIIGRSSHRTGRKLCRGTFHKLEHKKDYDTNHWHPIQRDIGKKHPAMKTKMFFNRLFI